MNRSWRLSWPAWFSLLGLGLTLWVIQEQLTSTPSPAAADKTKVR